MAEPSGRRGGARSVRQQLLLWLALPVALFMLLDAWASYRAALDTAQRALRALEDHARGVPGVLAARVRDCAAEAAGAVEAHGYDLFLAANGGDAADAGADGEAGR